MYNRRRSSSGINAVLMAFYTLMLLMTTCSGNSAMNKKAESPAKKLYDDKLKKSGYSKLIRPVGNTSDSLEVHVGLRLTSIIDVVSVVLNFFILK